MSFDIKQIIDDNKKNVDNIEIYFAETESSPVEFQNNRLHSLDKKYITGVGARVIHNGRVGFSSGNDLSKIDDIIKAAKDSSIYGEKVKYTFPDQSQSDVRTQPDIYDNELENPDNDLMIKMLDEAIAKIVSYEKNIKCEGEIKYNKINISIANSSGLFNQYKKTILSAWINALLVEKEGGFQWLSDFNSSTHKFDSCMSIADSVIKQIEYSKNIIPFKTKNIPVIFMSESAYILFKSIQLGASGAVLQKGISPLSDKKEKKIFDERIIINDNPLLDRLTGSRPFDGEGIDGRENVIIENGVFKNFIFDIETASRLGEKTSGNASRSYSSKPSCGFTNFIVEKGDGKIKEMISGLKEGILIYELLGAGQSNLIAGDYSVNIGLGFYVQNGEIKGRIKNAMIAGNIFEDLNNNIEQISSETRELSGMILPNILLKNKKIVS